MQSSSLPPDSSSLSDPAVEALWRNVVERWEEDAAHHAFLQICRERGRLADAAARYRGMSGDPARREIAQKRLTAITLLAFAELEASRSPTERPFVLNVLVALLLLTFLGLLGFGVYQVWFV